MIIRQIIMTIAMTVIATGIDAQKIENADASKVLLVYDKIDKGTQPFIDAFREQLKAAGLTVDEAAVESNAVTDITPYRTLFLYSRVMAFGNIAPVRDWLNKQQSLDGRNVFLFVTANRWAFEKHHQIMLKVIGERKGTVVDAVTMATKNMDAAQKRDAVAKQMEKLK